MEILMWLIILTVIACYNLAMSGWNGTYYETNDEEFETLLTRILKRIRKKQ